MDEENHTLELFSEALIKKVMDRLHVRLEVNTSGDVVHLRAILTDLPTGNSTSSPTASFRMSVVSPHMPPSLHVEAL